MFRNKLRHCTTDTARDEFARAAICVTLNYSKRLCGRWRFSRPLSQSATIHYSLTVMQQDSSSFKYTVRETVRKKSFRSGS